MGDTGYHPLPQIIYRNMQAEFKMLEQRLRYRSFARARRAADQEDRRWRSHHVLFLLIQGYLHISSSAAKTRFWHSGQAASGCTTSLPLSSKLSRRSFSYSDSSSSSSSSGGNSKP